MKEKKSDINIDAVITWVDGNDKKWQEKINTYKEKKIDFNVKKDSVRYNSIGEIQIAIKSIIKFAPFVNNIFLVTDDQTPDSFIELQKLAKQKNINIELIDHKVIFKGYEDCLPCFNSCSIGSMLFRIPNLSEHFIVFNDDTFLMRLTSPQDFFRNKTPIIRGEWNKFQEHRKLRVYYHKLRAIIGKPITEKLTGFKRFQQTSAKLAGMDKYVRRFHTPVCIRKSTLENFFDNKNSLKENVKFRFRNENQFIISSLSEHLEIKNNTFNFQRDTQLTYFRSYKALFLVKLKLFYFSKNKNKRFMTFQSLEMAKKPIFDYIVQWIDQRID